MSLMGASMWTKTLYINRNVAVPVLAVLYSQSGSLSDWRVPAAAGAWGQDAVLYGTWGAHREISDVRSQPCCVSVIRRLCTYSGRGWSFLMVSGDQRAGRDFTGAAWTSDVLTVALRTLGGNGGACKGRGKTCELYKPNKEVLMVANDQPNDTVLWSVDLRDFVLEVLRCPLWEGDWALFVRSVPGRGFIDSSSS